MIRLSKLEDIPYGYFGLRNKNLLQLYLSLEVLKYSSKVRCYFYVTNMIHVPISWRGNIPRLKHVSNR